MSPNQLPAHGRTLVKLRVANYRSLGREVCLSPGALTVLVGHNGAGKSNIVDALAFIADALSLGLGSAIDLRNGIESVRRWNRSSGGQPLGVKIALDLQLSTGPARYAIELRGSRTEEYWIASETAEVRAGAGRCALDVREGELRRCPEGLQPAADRQALTLSAIGGDPRFRELYATLRSFAAYAIYPNTLREPRQPSAVRPLQRHGENWTSVLKDQEPDTWKPQLVAALGKISGDIDDLRVARAGGRLVAQFHRTVQKPRMSSGRWFDAAQESDGTLRCAGILTALLQRPAPRVMAIEEPELTVHPGVLQVLADYLLEASDRGQVIVTTHSPDLLDHLPPEGVHLVTRSASGGTRIARLSMSHLAVVRQGLYSLGDLLRDDQLELDLELASEADAAA